MDAERTIAWRAADSFALREFLGLLLPEAPPDHSTISRTRRLIDLETHRAVMPPGFSYPVDTYVLGVGEPADVWVPYVFSSNERVRGNSYGYNLHVIGRLRDGMSIEGAQDAFPMTAQHAGPGPTPGPPVSSERLAVRPKTRR